MPHLEQGEAFSFPKESAVECCLNGDPNHSCHEGGCAGDPLLWYHAVLQRARTVTLGQRMGRLGSVLGSLSPPRSAASPSKGSALSAVLPANSPACPLTHASIQSSSLGIPALWHISAWPQGAPCPSMAPALPPTPLSLCPALPAAHTVFLPADDADGHFHECDRHQRCGAR